MPGAVFTLILAQPLMLSLLRMRPVMSITCTVASAPEPVAGLLMTQLPLLKKTKLSSVALPVANTNLNRVA